MELAIAIALVAGVILYLFAVRPKDLPATEPLAPGFHLEEKKARIYEGLRDLQFEYRVGKLSDEDYQRTKTGLQTELAGVMAELETIAGKPKPEAPAAKAAPKPGTLCPHCGASFENPMKFCGQCGKSMEAGA
ncbi:MAG: hypothetical protein U0Q16_29140 [Bryobacteraceae bacterium]